MEMESASDICDEVSSSLAPETATTSTTQVNVTMVGSDDDDDIIMISKPKKKRRSIFTRPQFMVYSGQPLPYAHPGMFPIMQPGLRPMSSGQPTTMMPYRPDTHVAYDIRGAMMQSHPGCNRTVRGANSQNSSTATTVVDDSSTVISVHESDSDDDHTLAVKPSEEEVTSGNEASFPKREHSDGSGQDSNEWTPQSDIAHTTGGTKLLHGNKNHCCHMCGYSSTLKHLLDRHLLRHEADHANKCHLCSFSTTQSRYLDKHLTTCHNTGDKEDRDKEAPNSSEIGESLQALDSIENGQDSNEQMLQSDVTYNTGGTKSHQRNKSYCCRMCGYSSALKRNLEVHLQGHKTNHAHKCYLCNFSTTQSRFLERHLDTCHPREQQDKAAADNGEIGGSIQASVNLGTANVMILEGMCRCQGWYVCLLCDFKTLHTRSAQSHSKCHNASTKEAYQCEQCSFSCNVMSATANHQAYHHGTYPSTKMAAQFAIISQSEARKTYDCTICSFKTVSAGAITKHAIEHGWSNENVSLKYECHFCEFNTGQLDAMKEHYNNKHTKHLHHAQDLQNRGSSMTLGDIEVRKYACPLCPYGARLRFALSRHLQVNHKLSKDEASAVLKTVPVSSSQPPPVYVTKKLRKCALCPFKGTYKKVQTHTEHHFLKAKFSCTECTFSTHTEINLASHMARLHPSIVDTERSTNEQEEVDSDNSSKLSPTENSTEVSKIGKYKCPRCVYSTDVWSSFQRHISSRLKPCIKTKKVCTRTKDFHPLSSPKNPGPVYVSKSVRKCAMCSFKGTYRQCWDHTRYNHSGAGKFKCTFCSFSTQQKSRLVDHRRTCHEDTDIENTQLKMKTNKVYRCSSCKYEANCLTRMKKHSIRHQNSPGKLLCHMCKFATTTQARLNIHFRMHEADKRRCPLCPYVATGPGLTRHMRGHRNLDRRQFKCKLCPYSSIDSHQIAKHEHLHEKQIEGKETAKEKQSESSLAEILISHATNLDQSTTEDNTIQDIQAKTGITESNDVTENVRGIPDSSSGFTEVKAEQVKMEPFIHQQMFMNVDVKPNLMNIDMKPDITRLEQSHNEVPNFPRKILASVKAEITSDPVVRHTCVVCGFEAASDFVLNVHQKRHTLSD